MNTENIKIGNIYIEDSNCLFIKKIIVIVVMTIVTFILLGKITDFFISSILSVFCFVIYYFIIFYEYINNNGYFDDSTCFLHFTSNINFNGIKRSDTFNIIKTQYEKETIIEKNTKYNYKVKLKIQTDDIWDSINMEYIKNWIQEQRKNDYETINKSI